MNVKEYSDMQLTSTHQEGDGGGTNVLYPAIASNYNAATKGQVYVEFDLPGDSITSGKLHSTNPEKGWYKWRGPNFIKPGYPFPQVKNISGILEVK